MPICENCDTKVILGDNLGLNALNSIEQLDVIPDDISEYIASNKERNYVIVKRFFEKENYSIRLNQISDKFVQAVLERIILDEENHIRLFTALLEEFFP